MSGKKTFGRLSFAAIVIFALACGSSDPTAPSRSVIDGTWATACVARDDQSSHKITYSFFENNTLIRLEEFFVDIACAQSLGTLRHEGVYAISVRQQVDVYDVDMQLNKVLARPSSAEGASVWNTAQFCGLTRWLSELEEEVISQSDPACGVFGVSRIDYFDLVEVDNDKSLTFGSRINHSEPRPNQVNASSPANVFKFIAH